MLGAFAPLREKAFEFLVSLKQQKSHAKAQMRQG
jgi:hypothetical protein